MGTMVSRNRTFDAAASLPYRKVAGELLNSGHPTGYTHGDIRNPSEKFGLKDNMYFVCGNSPVLPGHVVTLPTSKMTNRDAPPSCYLPEIALHQFPFQAGLSVLPIIGLNGSSIIHTQRSTLIDKIAFASTANSICSAASYTVPHGT